MTWSTPNEMLFAVGLWNSKVESQMSLDSWWVIPNRTAGKEKPWRGGGGSLNRVFATSPYIWMRCTEYFVEMGSWGLVSDWCFASLQPCLPDTFNSAVGWRWEGGGEQFRSILRKRRISQENQCWFCVCWPYTSCLDLPKPIEIMCARV